MVRRKFSGIAKLTIWVVILYLFLALGLTVIDADARRGDRCSAPGISNAFDPQLKWASRKFFSEPLRSKGFCYLKSLCYTESNLDPNAESAYAKGLCQITPPTLDTAERLGNARYKYKFRSNDLREVKTNVAAAVITLDRMWRIWTSKRSNQCRLELAFASYNAGGGNIIKAQAASGGERCWEGIRESLHEITGRHSKETLDYVSRVFKNYIRLRLGLRSGDI